MGNMELARPVNYTSAFFIVLFTVCRIKSSFAQDSSIFDIHLNKEYVNTILLNTKNVLSAPFKINEKSLMSTGGILCLKGGMMMLDKEVKLMFQRNRTKGLDKITFYGLEPLGSGLYTSPLIVLLYMNGKFKKNNRMERLGLLCAQTGIITSGFVQLPKFLFQRQRPYQNIPGNPFLFNGPLGNLNSRSLPSGHTAFIFSLASMLSLEYNEKKWVGILAYSIATLTGVSRIYDNKHWASDVILGAAIGTGISRVIYFNCKNSAIK